MTFNFDLTVTLGLILTIAMGIGSWFRMRNKDVDRCIEACNERLDRHDQRLMATEQTLRGMPAKDDFHNLQLSLSELRGDMREIKASQAAAAEFVKRQEVVTTRVEQYLLERSDK